MIRLFKYTLSGMRQIEVGKNSQYVVRGYNRLGKGIMFGYDEVIRRYKFERVLGTVNGSSAIHAISSSIDHCIV